MADISEVRDGIVSLVESAIYPAGVGVDPQPPVKVKVYGGWPDPKKLDDDLTHAPNTQPSALHVSVYNLGGGTDRTRYPSGYEEERLPINTYAAAILGNTVTITGAAPQPFRPQNVAIGLFPKSIYSTATTANQTPQQIAAALAALIQADIPGASASGANVIIPQPYQIALARVGGVGVAVREVGRTEKAFQITTWTDTDANRTMLGRLITPVIAAQVRLTLGDGSVAHLTCRSNTDSDKSQRQSAYRRDLVYSVEYATTQDMDAPQLVALDTVVQSPPGSSIIETVE